MVEWSVQEPVEEFLIQFLDIDGTKCVKLFNELIRNLKRTGYFQRIVSDMNAIWICYEIARNWCRRAEPQLFEFPRDELVQYREFSLKSRSFFALDSVKNFFGCKARSLPPIGLRCQRQAVAGLPHVAMAPETWGKPGVRSNRVRCLAHPGAAVP